ncbi:MraY family glycosyltransferase [Stratiformator vulcanicus]|uniref:WecA-like glycosyltransferase n=1 Tax=Stratiformator vulcanicus TaxID=2527980 RepID=A0A517R5L0_9PLAN|nr:MraY family glycosyltransferase [Stratiformator vulcanicus]QDT39178.1 WecA-like glycosyltransferase [Stratiformator vulcanicus]
MLAFVAVCILPAFVLSAALTEIVRRLAPRVGLLDKPAARKVHQTPTPLGGGIAVFLAVMIPMVGALVAAVLANGGYLPEWLVPATLAPHAEGAAGKVGQVIAIFVSGTILAATGLVDDFRPVPWQPRLAIQIVAAAILAIFGPRISAFIDTPAVGMLITGVWVLVLVNAFNFLDNMNGLSGGVAMICAIATALIMLTTFERPHFFVGGVMMMLAAALAGFLIQNWQGRIFMGDAGSYFVGLLMATFTAAATFYETDVNSDHVILAPLCVLAVPLYDLCSVVLIRLRERRSPFHPDKSHFSHRLVQLGMRTTSAVLLIYLATITTGLAGLLLYEVEDWYGASLIVLLVVCVLAIIAVLETVGVARAKVLAAAKEADGARSP